MPRDDEGQLRKVGRGCPTIYHEGVIDKYCENWGFVKYGFGRFVKMLFLNERSESQKSPVEIYSTLPEKPTQNAINKSLKRHCNSILDGIPDDICLQECTDSCDCSGNSIFGCDWFGSHSPISFCSKYDKILTAIPDCWRYTGRGIEVIEVCDSSVTSFSKLKKYSLIHDMLFQCFGNDIELRVFEYFIRTGTMVEHNMNSIFDMWENCDYFGENISEKEQARMYQNFMAGKPLENMQFMVERI